MNGSGVLDGRLRSWFFVACGLPVALLVAAPAAAATIEVRAVMSKDGAEVYFDPVGVRIQPGDTVRWIQVNGYHSVTAYHPANGDRESRIPERPLVGCRAVRDQHVRLTLSRGFPLCVLKLLGLNCVPPLAVRPVR